LILLCKGKRITRYKVQEIINEVIEENNKLFIGWPTLPYPQATRLRLKDDIQDISEEEVIFYTHKIENTEFKN
jgi:hypothetical protein